MGHSPHDIDSHTHKLHEQLKGRSPVCINMFTVVNDLSTAQFVTINVDGTVTSNDTCVVISRPSRFHNFYVLQLYRLTEPMWPRCHVGCVELWNVHYSRYTDTTVCWNLDTSHVYFNLSISEVAYSVTLKGQRSICLRTVDVISALVYISTKAIALSTIVHTCIWKIATRIP